MVTLTLNPFSRAEESTSDLMEVAKESHRRTPFDPIYLFSQAKFAIKYVSTSTCGDGYLFGMLSFKANHIPEFNRHQTCSSD